MPKPTLQELADKERKRVEAHQTKIPDEYGPLSPDAAYEHEYGEDHPEDPPPVPTPAQLHNGELRAPLRHEIDHRIDETPPETPPPPPPQPQVPLPTALLIELKRIREVVLPQFYAARHHEPTCNDSAQGQINTQNINQMLMLINGSLRLADYATMDRDDAMMLAVLTQLRSFQ